MNSENTKKCSACKFVKVFDEFYARPRLDKYPTSAAGYSDRCKACCRARTARWRATDPKSKEKTRSWHLQANYGITLEQYNEMFVAQDGRCAICCTHQAELKKGLVVDHDHETGAIRGLLCSLCNPGLGYFRDREDLLLTAVEYLKKSKTPLQAGDAAVVEMKGRVAS